MRIEKKAENFSGALAAPAGSTLTLVNMLVPAKAKMRLLSFGNYMSVAGNWGKVRWDFFINGVLMYPYFAIRDQVGFAASRQEIENKVLYGGQLLEVIVTQESGAADPTVGVSLQWEWIYEG